MAKTIPQRELRNENAKVIDACCRRDLRRHAQRRSGRRTFITRDQVAALAAAGVRIDRHQFREDLDRLIDEGL